ncbi:MAG: polyprenyl synthetase family protein [Acidimicrobiales bacterium]
MTAVPTSTPPLPAPPALDRARRLVTPIMREAVGRLTPDMRRVASYHLGWADADGAPLRADSGKCVRPALALLSAEAVGADGAVSLPGGAAVELVHNFSLIHDDVMDGDRERRHRPTVWAVYGIGPAIIAGDALHTLAHQILLEVPGPHGPAAAAALTAATAQMIAGQADDLAFETEPEVSMERCLTMESAKTGAILACASSIGAILAGGPREAVSALYDFGLHVGLSFQAVDDILGIWGDPSQTGKPVASDLRQHKKTLPVVAALARADGHLGELVGLLARADLSDADLTRAVDLVEASGGRALALAEAQRHLGAALDALDRAPLAPGAAAEMAQLARFVTDRER